MKNRAVFDEVRTLNSLLRLVFTGDGVGRKWKRSDSSDSDSVALMIPLTTPIFDFH